jgi:formamidopyrimidine-DNA glycosylase
MQAWLARTLGPDALTVSGDALAQRVQGSARCIKAALLDQGVLAGVGNIYADEALFRAGVRPQARCSRLAVGTLHALATHLRHLLSLAVQAGGSTVRDYVDATGKAGTAQLLHAVYGRGGHPCTQCGSPLRQALVAQRTTVWCGTCQSMRPVQKA